MKDDNGNTFDSRAFARVFAALALFASAALTVKAGSSLDGKLAVRPDERDPSCVSVEAADYERFFRLGIDYETPSEE